MTIIVILLFLGLTSCTKGGFATITTTVGTDSSLNTVQDPTPTPVATISPTPTMAPELSPTPTPSSTPTMSPTPTPTMSPTPTPTMTPTPSPTPTATPVAPVGDSPFLPGSSTSLMVHDPGNINFYLDQKVFNPLAASGTFSGVRASKSVALGKIVAGNSSPLVAIKIYNDTDITQTLTQTSSTGEVFFNFESPIPVAIPAKSQVVLKFRAQSTSMGFRNADLKFDFSSGKSFILSISVNVK